MDDALAPTDDPFAQLDPEKVAPIGAPAAPTDGRGAQVPEPAPPVSQDNEPDPFAELGPVGPGESTAFGAFRRSAGRGVAPAATGLVAMGAGAELGGLAGSVVPGWGNIAGAIGGGLVGGIAGGYLGSAAQDWLLSKLPDTWVDALGQSDRQRKLDEAQHATASFLGGMTPYAVTMRPGVTALASLPENATALQRIMANKATAAAFGGAVNGGMELGQEAVHGDVNWQHIAIATAFGTVFNQPTRLGQTITEAGARPVRAATGIPHPTVAQAGDLKVMGPGVTEEVFHGTQEQAPSAALTAQEAARQEHVALAEPPEPDLQSIARRMEPELFARMEELEGQRETFRAWLAEGEAPVAAAHLDKINAEIAELQPEIGAAYRRAADTTGTGIVEPEQFPSFAAMLAAHEHGVPPPRPDPALENAAEFQRIVKDIDENWEQNRMVGKANLFPDEINLLRAAGYTVGDDGHMSKGDLIKMKQEAERVRKGLKKGGGNVPSKAVPEVPTEPLLGEGAQVPGVPGVQPAGENVPGVAGGSAPQPVRSIGEQRAFIANDVAESLIAAGRPEEEARAAGQLVAARYVTRAGRFDGKLGTPEELYAREAAAIAGPSGKALEPASAKFREKMADMQAGKISSQEYVKAREEMYRARDAMELAQKEAVTQHYDDVAAGRAVSPDVELSQEARGKIRLAPGRRPIITLMKDANASTFIHESGHQYLEELMRDGMHPDAPMGLRDDMQTVRDWLGVKDDIKTKHHEKFARGFEQYIREGVAPSTELASVFAKFRNWLLSIYQSIRGLGAEISPEIRGVFDRMLEMEPQRTIIAPERQSPTLLHDIHEAEARTVEPHEAEPAMDRILAETPRYLADQPPEIVRELETAREEIAAEDAAVSGAAGTEGGASAGGSRPLGPGGVEAGAEPAGGAGRAESGAVKPSGAGAGAESAKPERRAFLTEHPNTALAPGPTEFFGARESAFTDRAGNIRLDTLNTPEDVKQAIRDSAAENNDFIGDRRGVVTDGQVLELAHDIGMDGAAALVAKHVEGQAYNAEQVVALRKLLRESAASVSSFAKKFAETGDDTILMEYAQAKERLSMVQKTVAGATAEAGRALRAFRKLPAGEGVDTMALEQMMREATGKTLFQLKEEAVLVSSLDAPHKINKFLQQRSLGAMLQEGWILGLLSGPGTHVTNAVSNTLMALMHFGPEKALAAVIGKIAHGFGREGTYTRLGEIAAAARGAKEGLAPALHAGGEAFKRSASGLLPGEEAPVSGVLEGMLHDDLVARATLDQTKTMRDVGAATFSLMKSVPDSLMATAALAATGGVKGAPLANLKYSPQGAIPDVQIKGMTIPVGTAIRAPGRLLSMADTFTSSLNFTAELNAIAYRMAADEGHTGTAFWSRIADMTNSPTPEMLKEARGPARELTFMDKSGELAKRLQFLANYEPNIPGLGPTKPIKFMMPFINVVSRILDQTLIKRTPLGLLSRELQADVLGKNGNIAQEQAVARMVLGTGALLTYGALAAQGLITGSGPKDPKENAVWRINNQPHSIRIGSTWYQVSKLGPQGMLMGMAADLNDIKGLVDQEKWAQAASLLWHAIVQNTLDQSALQGISDVAKATQDSDRYGAQYIKNFASTAVPFSGLMGSIVRMRDPYVRETWTAIDAMKSKVPGLSESLHPKIDIYGEPVPVKDALLGRGLSGVYMQKLRDDPVSRAMLALNIHPGPVDKKIRNYELTPEQYEMFARTAGRMMKSRLDLIVNSPDFQTRWPPEAKVAVIKATIDQSREVARGMVMAKWPDIPAKSAALEAKKRRGEKLK